jgi:photosystem II stability/assembly factor-like uncharacterized protein
METILYAGTDKGVVTLRSRDGRSFDVAAQGLKDWSVPEVQFVPGEPNKVLAGTRGDGVWLSEDFGETWKKPSYGKRGPGKVRCVTIDPSDSKRVYAGTEPIDVFVSEDQAKTWVRLDSVWDVPSVPSVWYPMATVEPHTRDIAVDPSDPNTIYAALQVGYIIKSTDGGETWKLLSQNLDCDVHTMVIDPSDPQHMVIATGGYDSRPGRAPGRALYQTRDGGENWTPVGMNFEQEYSVPVEMSQKDPKLVFAGIAIGTPPEWQKNGTPNALLVRSTDGGSNWERVGDGKLPESAFTDAITIAEENPSRVYAASRRGTLYLSEDGGDTWDHLEVTIPGGLANMKLAHA